MVPASFHDFFSGCATIAGALIGLLFVAVSVAPGKLAGRGVEADYQVKAGADSRLLAAVAGMARRPADQPDAAAPGSPGQPGSARKPD